MIQQNYQNTTQTFDADEALSVEYDVEFEILGMLINGKPEYQQLILDHTTDKMFSDKGLRGLYKIIRAYVNELGISALNPYDLSINLNGIVSIERIDYIKEIARITSNYTQSANAVNWIKRLHKLYKKRAEKECNSFEQYEEVKNELNNAAFYDNSITLYDIAEEYDATYDDASNSTIKTHYNAIDTLIGGFQAGNFSILAGATGMGKTAMALNLAVRMAENNTKVLLFSLEMNNLELFTRLAGIETGISTEKLRNRTLTAWEFDKLQQFKGSDLFETLNRNIKLDEQANLDINKIEAIGRKTDADIIFIDYLGLIKGDKKNNTYEEISDVSRRLKLLAIEINKPIIALHQLNRDMKNRSDKRPTLSDIRDSGKIEQDADFILMAYRPSYYFDDADKTEYQLIIAKSRHSGGAGQSANLIFLGNTQQIKGRIGCF